MDLFLPLQSPAFCIPAKIFLLQPDLPAQAGKTSLPLTFGSFVYYTTIRRFLECSSADRK